MLEAIILGIVQGVTEWLPVSSQGTLTLVGSALFGMTPADAVAFALWLHIGTALAAVLAFRTEVIGVLREVFTTPTRPSPLLRFLVVATLISSVIAVPVLLALGNLPEELGAGVMIVIGAFMLVTGGLQVRRRQVVQDVRDRADLTLVDALAAGVAQGFSSLPGLSRSGLTVAALLGRKIDRPEALALSFLMSIPASVGASVLFLVLEPATVATTAGVVGALVAAVVGLVTIRGLIAVARRINFGAFVLIAGLAILGGGLWQVLD